MSDEVLVGESGPSPAGWHSVEAYLRCPKEYQFKHIRQVRKPESETKEAFAVGIIVHAGKKVWFANKFRMDDALWQLVRDEARKECELQKLPVSATAEQRGLRYVQEYIEHWSKYPLPRPRAVEHLVGPCALAGESTERTARLDDVSQYAESGWALALGETKTSSASPQEVLKQYQLHGQPMLQHALYRLDTKQGAGRLGPASGTVLDVISKGYGKNASKFARFFIPVTDHQMKWFVDSMAKYVRAANKVKWDTDVRRNTTACVRAISGRAYACEFQELCIHGKSATGKYCMGEEGASLRSWQPEEGKETPPWL